MVTSRKSRSRKKDTSPRVKSIKLDFTECQVTSFGGLALTERLALRLGLWNYLRKLLPHRPGRYDWMDVLKPAIAGLLTGSRGTVACEEVRKDQALMDLLGVRGAPEETMQ